MFNPNFSFKYITFWADLTDVMVDVLVDAKA